MSFAAIWGMLITPSQAATDLTSLQVVASLIKSNFAQDYKVLSRSRNAMDEPTRGGSSILLSHNGLES